MDDRDARSDLVDTVPRDATPDLRRRERQRRRGARRDGRDES